MNLFFNLLKVNACSYLDNNLADKIYGRAFYLTFSKQFYQNIFILSIDTYIII